MSFRIRQTQPHPGLHTPAAWSSRTQSSQNLNFHILKWVRHCIYLWSLIWWLNKIKTCRALSTEQVLSKGYLPSPPESPTAVRPSESSKHPLLSPTPRSHWDLKLLTKSITISLSLCWCHAHRNQSKNLIHLPYIYLIRSFLRPWFINGLCTSWVLRDT